MSLPELRVRAATRAASTSEVMNWSKFFFMGGYALYVWGSYGVTFVLLAAEVLMLRKRKRDLEKRESFPEPDHRSAHLETSL